MTRIGVISDTHIPINAKKIPDEIYTAFKDVDLILHAGDLIELSVLNDLKKLADTQAVRGNMDSMETQRHLPVKKIIKVEKFSIGLIHGFGSPFNLMDRIKDEFSEKVDAIVFGHSHAPANEVRDGILYFNPGSPTDKIFARYNSYGMLTVDKKIEGRIIKLT
ncbi:MAG: metallophosphoesterase family protein [Candidatus Omnitrophica bacterium]|nr:metallophosphoesterase family protein [Candidatus Omnitrophota bacterium]